MEYLPGGELTALIDTAGRKTHIVHHFGITNSLGQRTPYQEITDPNGNRTVQEYDAYGRIIRVTSFDPFGEQTHEQLSRYDGQGNLIYHLDHFKEEGRYRHTRWDYDCMGNRIREWQEADTPWTRATQFVYNLKGQQQAIIYPDGTSLHSQYDSLGRLSISFTEDGSHHLQYHYDILGHLISCHDLAHHHTTTRIYNSEGYLSEEHLGNGLSMRYQYDRIGRLTQVTIPDQSSIDYVYRGTHLKEVIRRNTLGEERYKHFYVDYDLLHRPKELKLIGKGGALHHSWDTLGRLTKIFSNHWQQVADAFDSNDNLLLRYTRRSDQQEAEVATYKYNSSDELLEEKGPIEHTYTYDSLFNRKSADGMQYCYDQYQQFKGDGYHYLDYDARGNLLSQAALDGTSIKYTYDSLNRLIEVEKGDRKHVYTYDFLGRRLTKTRWEEGRPIQCDRFFYIGENEVGKCDTLGFVQELRVLGTGKGAELGASVAIELEGKAYAPIHDLHGHIACLIDYATGEASAYYQYSAFGETTLDGPEASKNPWRFSSKRYDPETGFYYFGKRYYTPKFGRWISSDPLGYEAGPSLYSYVSNAPLASCDLYGLYGIRDGGIGSPQRELSRHLEARHRSSPRIRADRQEKENFGNSGTFCLYCDVAAPALSKSRKGLGRTIHGVAYHVLPTLPIIELARNGFMYTGKWISGETDSYVSSANEPGPSIAKVGTWIDPNHRIISQNGILNTSSEALSHVLKTSELYGGEEVIGILDPTHGFANDLGNCLSMMFGCQTKASRLFAKTIKDCTAEMGPNGKITALCHSRGGRVAFNASKLLTPQEKSCVYVKTFGSAKLISKTIFKDAQNFTSMGDPVPIIADPIGYVCGLFDLGGISMTSLKCQGIVGLDHAWDGKTYLDARIWVADNYVKKKTY